MVRILLLPLVSFIAFSASLPIDSKHPQHLLETIQQIALHNGNPGKTFFMKVTGKSALNHKEFSKLLSAPKKPNSFYDAIPYERIEFKSRPEAVDWRDSGAGNSANSWAYSVIGAMEAQYRIKSGEAVDLSTEHMMDCAGLNERGFITDAYNFILKNGGVRTESSYILPQKPCGSQEGAAKPAIKFYSYISEGSEYSLMATVATKGPVSVGIDASHPSFQNYGGGVYFEPACNPDNINLAVLVVGYGTDAKDGDYWLIKNSFGSNWGEEGYMRLARNKNNHCGIASMAVFPQL